MGIPFVAQLGFAEVDSSGPIVPLSGTADASVQFYKLTQSIDGVITVPNNTKHKKIILYGIGPVTEILVNRFIYIVFFFILSCSLNSDSAFWSKNEKIKTDKKITKILFEDIKPNEEEFNPGFPVLKLPEDLGNSNVGPMGPDKIDIRPFYDQEGALVFSPEQMGMFQANQPGGFGGNNNQFLNRRDELAGLAYGGDVNRSVMNGQNGMSASDKIDNRIMKNLEFQNKFNMGGRTMSTYDKLRSIADSIAEG